jgi:hypothetical protein
MIKLLISFVTKQQLSRKRKKELKNKHISRVD